MRRSKRPNRQISGDMDDRRRQRLDGWNYKFLPLFSCGTGRFSMRDRCPEFELLEGGGFRSATNLPGGRHRIEDAGDDLLGTGAVDLVDGLGLEELRVREHDPELVVQLVEQHAQIRIDLERVGSGVVQM